MAVDPALLHYWLAARSVARGLPSPVSDFGGYRVDTGTEEEIARWVFPAASDNLAVLARSLNEAAYLIKLCGSARQLRKLLPPNWRLQATGHFMQSAGAPPTSRLPEGYRIELCRQGQTTRASIFTAPNVIAATGYAADTESAFVYDRIATHPDHRRRGLASGLMRALHDTRVHFDTPQLLVATDEGRMLYDTLGWDLVSPYVTASIALPVM